MHETSLIQFTLDAVERRAMQLGMRHVKSIHLVVGDMRGALPNLLQHGFAILTSRRPLFAGAVLEVETRSVVLQCRCCGCRFTVEEFHNITCPDCGAPEYAVAQGNELLIESFEGE